MLSELFLSGTLEPGLFPLDQPAELALRDDTWLWGLIRSGIGLRTGEPMIAAALTSLLYRDTSQVTLLWKNRAEYRGMHDELFAHAGVQKVKAPGPAYDAHLSEKVGVPVRTHWLRFSPLGDETVWLTNERGDRAPTPLGDDSLLAGSLAEVWENEVRYHVILFGVPISRGTQRTVVGAHGGLDQLPLSMVAAAPE